MTTPLGGAPTGAAVDLWSLRVGALDEAAVDPRELDAEERGRLERLRRAEDRVRYGAAHVALRRLLGTRLGVEPAEVAYFRQACPCCGAPHGRPAVLGVPGAPHFSLSHGGDWVLIAMAAHPVGVDVEPYPAAADVPGLTSVLHPRERREIAEGAFAPAVFARIWARKEAYLKGLGTGLGRALDADYLGGTGAEPAPEGWSVHGLPVGDGHAAAVAVRAVAAGPRVDTLGPGFVGAGQERAGQGRAGR
ncbi:4'-phosphopantetheinyl transferase superfamily protein [Streptomyces sp. NPDC006458]|uniref:4'-phosphopantetheinyl transferase family protein n=1 Tax=Streptomyces sp. NPDC006458 TaxID=3154302 RepID=UPI0033A5CAFE